MTSGMLDLASRSRASCSTAAHAEQSPGASTHGARMALSFPRRRTFWRNAPRRAPEPWGLVGLADESVA
eukprot:5347436-Alexandrium_andersonii.AAC.1